MARRSNSYISRVVYHAAGNARTGAFLVESGEGLGWPPELRKLNMVVKRVAQMILESQKVLMNVN